MVLVSVLFWSAHVIVLGWAAFFERPVLLTALQFADEFPKAEIYAFEPGTENMKRLVANLVGKPGVKRIKSGLGAAVSTQRLIVDAAHPSMARISDMRTALLRASKLTRSTLSA